MFHDILVAAACILTRFSLPRRSHNAQVVGYDGTEFLCSALNVFRVAAGCSDKSVKSAMLKLKLPTVLCGVLQGLPDRDDVVGVDCCVGTNEEVAMPVARTLGRLSLQEVRAVDCDREQIH